ncbi:MAG: transcriptional regulator, MerR family [Geminicoccaceae bacterium]|nr:transcriptional regulator, MerR family [Geminicoccaceae bacterium]
MNEPPASAARVPLRAVMRRTGLSADVLRAWERRYGAVKPTRSSGGQRLYSAEDVERLILLQRATSGGHSIGEIARLDREALDALLDRTGRDPATHETAALNHLVREAIAATDALDDTNLERVLRGGALSLGSEVFIDEALPRFLRAVGDRWHRGSLTPAHEHLASQGVRRVTAWLSAAYGPRSDAPTIVVATPAGELHELGAGLAAVVSAGAGWRPVYLGANLPAVDIIAAATQVRASVVALSTVYVDGDAALRELQQIRTGLPNSATLIIGGAAAGRLERSLDGTAIRVLPDLATLRRALREHEATGQSTFETR